MPNFAKTGATSDLGCSFGRPSCQHAGLCRHRSRLLTARVATWRRPASSSARCFATGNCCRHSPVSYCFYRWCWSAVAPAPLGVQRRKSGDFLGGLRGWSGLWSGHLVLRRLSSRRSFGDSEAFLEWICFPWCPLLRFQSFDCFAAVEGLPNCPSTLCLRYYLFSGAPSCCSPISWKRLRIRLCISTEPLQAHAEAVDQPKLSPHRYYWSSFGLHPGKTAPSFLYWVARCPFSAEAGGWSWTGRFSFGCCCHAFRGSAGCFVSR